MYIHIHTYMYIHIHIKTLFVICFKIPHTQMAHHMALGQLNWDKSQLTGFHKMQDTGEGNPRKKYSKTSQQKWIKMILKW